MQRQEKIKYWVIETVDIPPSKPLFGHALAHKTLILSSCHFKATMRIVQCTWMGKHPDWELISLIMEWKCNTQIVEQVSLGFLCCALLMCIPEFKMGTTNRKWSMNQLPVLWLIFFHGYPQDGLVSLLHNHMHSCCHILKQKKTKTKAKAKNKRNKKTYKKIILNSG